MLLNKEIEEKKNLAEGTIKIKTSNFYFYRKERNGFKENFSKVPVKILKKNPVKILMK